MSIFGGSAYHIIIFKKFYTYAVHPCIHQDGRKESELTLDEERATGVQASQMVISDLKWKQKLIS